MSHRRERRRVLFSLGGMMLAASCRGAVKMDPFDAAIGDGPSADLSNLSNVDAGGVADAATSIDIGSTTDPLADGVTRVISGTGFGTSTPYKKTWLGGKGGFIEGLGEDASFRNSSPPTEFLFDGADWRIASTQPRSSLRTKSLLWKAANPRNGNPYNGTILYRSGRPAVTTSYTHVLYYFTHDAQPMQWKIMRYVALGPEEGSYSGYTDDDVPDLYVTNFIGDGFIALNGTAYDGKYHSHSEFFGDSAPPATSSGTAGAPGVWMRFETEFRDATTLTSSDAYISWRFTNAVTGELIGQVTIDGFQLYPGSGSRIKYLVLQNYTGVQGATPNPEGGDAHVWMQDHFIQIGSRARVMLGDAATYAACTRFELCDEVSALRTDTSITAIVSQGAFATLGGLYWYAWTEGGQLASTNGIPLV